MPEIREVPDKGARRVAVVIGNSDYVNVPRLKNPAHDAQAVGRLFESMGFETWLGLNLSLAELRELLRTVTRSAPDADLLAFYYAGHAVQIDGSNYLLPADAQIESETDVEMESISLNLILDLFEATAGARLIFLDACRNDPFSGRTSEPSATRGFVAEKGLAQVKARAGTLIMYATEPGKVSYDGAGENSPFAEALLNHLATPGLPLEVAMMRIRRAVAEATHYEQIPWTHSSLLIEIVLVPGAYIAQDFDEGRKEPIIDNEVLAAFQTETEALINGRQVRFLGGDEQPALKALWDNFREGVNTVEMAGRRFRLWVEANTARVLWDLYAESHAILVAIDDYPNAAKVADLGFMVPHAKALAAQLERLGFPKDNIIELYNEDATKDRIEKELRAYWDRSDRERTDRLLFYFGGHGKHLLLADSSGASTNSIGFLVPYDYNWQLPLQSGILLDDIRTRHLRFSTVHHMLVLIDACSSGLVLPRILGDEQPLAVGSALHWQRIQANLQQRQHAIIVAGTGEEEALYVNGGVFTKALLEGLDGKADYNKDGLIEFGELNFWLEDNVARATADEGILQKPSSFSDGSGRIFFELPQG